MFYVRGEVLSIQTEVQEYEQEISGLPCLSSDYDILCRCDMRTGAGV